MTDDELDIMIRLAELVSQGVDPHMPVGTQLKALANTVLWLSDERVLLKAKAERVGVL